MSDQRFTPYVPADSNMREFTVRALILGLFTSIADFSLYQVVDLFTSWVS